MGTYKNGKWHRSSELENDGDQARPFSQACIDGELTSLIQVKAVPALSSSNMLQKVRE